MPNDDAHGAAKRPRRRRATGTGLSLIARGEPMVWLTGGSLALCLAMIIGFLVLVLAQGLFTFWPADLVQVKMLDEEVRLGEITRRQIYPLSEELLATMSPESAKAAHAFLEQAGGDAVRPKASRRLLRTGNFELTGEHFYWVEDFAVAAEERPEWGIVVERIEWGRFYGYPKSYERQGKVVASTPADAWAAFLEDHDDARDRWHARRELETEDVGHVNHRLESARLAVREAEIEHGEGSSRHEEAQARHAEIEEWANGEFTRIRKLIDELDGENDRYRLVMTTAQGQEQQLVVADIVRAYPANQLGLLSKTGIYLGRWWEFLWDDPREANSEGGVYPAIFGTVLMTLIMTVAVVPFGVLAALYLREYAKDGPLISMVRISINNLAGVPSIVFGVFGLGFFCYIIGASIDELFFSATLPNPTFGKGGVLWASLTLALLTLPVVIVATEEALAAVPNSQREGSYACGGSKWQTIQRIVLPSAMPGIMTGMILAMARGAGEVAPLMLVGAVKLAPELPSLLHPERSFMHLGFHIYDLGFQSQNSEAAKPMVYTTTLLLIALITLLNVTAIWLRSRLRARFIQSQF